MKPRWKRIAWIAPLGLLGMAVFIAIGGEIVKLLWNWLLPQLFNWRQITFWEALGILLLCRILFGSLGLHGGSRSGMRQRMVDRVADRMAERWEAMTPEERERFRQRLRERCGLNVSAAETPPGVNRNNDVAPEK
ncbi:MAG: hypothetical protein PHX83_12440 [Acidobacteriia bacterium]|nr:hypothetical protein [Terriglobia bacterium]